MTTAIDHVVAWHDAECGHYVTDLPAWRALAAEMTGPIVDVGAGTGRVALDLAAFGHEVHAVDLDPVLLAALRERDPTGRVRTTAADAERLELAPASTPLVLLPMQTIQLLGDRPALLRAARRALTPGGRLVVAVAEPLWAWDASTGPLPAADVLERDGWRFVSQAIAVLDVPGGSEIRRERTAIAPDGSRDTTPDVIVLRALDEATLHAEGAAAGLRPLPGFDIPPTDEHVGSRVVAFRA